MSDINCKQVVNLQNYIDTNKVAVMGGSIGRVRPKENWNASK